MELTEESVGSFLRAVGEGRLEEVKHSLEACPGLVNTAGPHPFWGGRPQPLHVAVETKCREMVELLLEHGASLDGDNAGYDHWSPLMLALHRGFLVRELRERGARIGLAEALLLGEEWDVDQLPAEVPNQGSWVSFARTTRAIDRLVTLGASTTQPDRWGSTPMQSLAKAGAALAEHLALRHGVKVDAVSQVRLGQVPEDVSDPNLLAAAVESGREDLVRTLVERGASPDASEALHKAAWRGDAAMARLLIALGASVRLRDGQHDATPLDWAETSLAITGNEACRGVIEYLQTQ